MKEIELSEDQQKAYDKLVDWIHSTDKNEFILTGFAGTGKSSLISKLQKDKDIRNIAYTAYTGKAGTILKQKLDEEKIYYSYVGTIHKLIYHIDETEPGKKKFVLKRVLNGINLIVVDEASMIGKKLLSDLRSFKIPILFVGDQGQLPPVGDDIGIDLNNPDAILTKIHRQAEGNSIITFSRDIREGVNIPFGRYGVNVIKLNQCNEKHISFLNKVLNNYNIEKDIVICGFNKTRRILNSQIRAQLGFKGNIPKKGEKIICLKNNYDSGNVNGLVGILNEYIPNYEEVKVNYGKNNYTFSLAKYTADFYSEGIKTNLCLEEQFNSTKIFNDEVHLIKNILGDNQIDLLDFSYAISCHKAQGSGFENVIVFEEISSKLWDQVKWNYTAVTRAINKLIFVS